MRNYRIIFLLLSSLVFSSCAYHKLASYKKQSDLIITQTNLQPVIPPAVAVKYKASIDVLNKHFTGLIILKQTDADTKHLVFVTELGMRMFDFEMKGDSMKPVFVFDALNKPKLVTALVRNFKTMLLIDWFNKTAELSAKSGKEVLHLKSDKHHLFVFRDAGNYALKQQVFNKHKKETKTIYTNNYNSIKLKQYGFVKLFIELEKIID
ncbi:MAG: hypothetical protein KA163_04720 [Bacteroidia bacterium]|nr:hypothetical protein [Bacteroidia bacterium]